MREHTTNGKGNDRVLQRLAEQLCAFSGDAAQYELVKRAIELGIRLGLRRGLAHVRGNGLASAQSIMMQEIERGLVASIPLDRSSL